MIVRKQHRSLGLWFFGRYSGSSCQGVAAHDGWMSACLVIVSTLRSEQRKTQLTFLRRLKRSHRQRSGIQPTLKTQARYPNWAPPLTHPVLEEVGKFDQSQFRTSFWCPRPTLQSTVLTTDEKAASGEVQEELWPKGSNHSTCVLHMFLRVQSCSPDLFTNSVRVMPQPTSFTAVSVAQGSAGERGLCVSYHTFDPDRDK